MQPPSGRRPSFEVEYGVLALRTELMVKAPSEWWDALARGVLVGRGFGGSALYECTMDAGVAVWAFHRFAGPLLLLPTPAIDGRVDIEKASFDRAQLISDV